MVLQRVHTDHCLLVFLSMLRPPPGSTLFPSTTLFRSLLELLLRNPRRVVSRELALERVWGSPHAAKRELAANDAARERKSTRLNSSHQISSYAVFSSKKKNQEPLGRTRPVHESCVRWP